MFLLFFNLIYFLIGHLCSAVLVYLNHRLVFHGPLGRLPVLRSIKKIHSMHHAHAYTDDRNEYITTPFWAKSLIVTTVALVGIFGSWSFAAGLGSFGIVYAYRHWRIHNSDETSRFSVHHRIHHTVNPKSNFSGVYPFIDRIFGTSF